MGMGKSTWEAIDTVVEDVQEDEAWDLNEKYDEMSQRQGRATQPPSYRSVGAVKGGAQR